MLYKLFEYQENNLSQVEDFFSHGGKRVILCQPTGTGKSLIASTFVTRRKEQKKYVYFITHSRALVSQFSDHLTDLGLYHGIIAAGCPTLNYRVQVISVQSLLKRAHLIEEPDTIVVDEAHHFASTQFMKLLEIWPNVNILGLTATPHRMSGEPLSMFENIIQSPSVKWFIDNCFLSDYEYYIPQDFDTTGIHRQCGEFNGKELAERVANDKTRVGNLVEYYKKYSDNKPAIAFATSIADSEEIAKRFTDGGYYMKALHSKMQGSIIDELGKCRAGELSRISSCEAIGEGVDVKGLTCMIDARPTESLVVQMQHWGRVLRAKYADGYDLSTLEGRRAAMQAGGKGKAQILDFSSNYLRHGLPDDDREWSLGGKIKTVTESKYKRCPECQHPVPNFVKVCPYCAHEFIVIAQVEETPERSGELVPISKLAVTDKNGLTLAIARGATNLKQAIKIAEARGVNHAAAWFIWRQVLKKDA